MRYYKMVNADGKITAIGTGNGGDEITEEEYAAIAEEIAQKAELVSALADGALSPEDIREEWREDIVRRAEALSVRDDKYTQEALEAMSNAELEQILGNMGVSANMNKENMVTLILALQEKNVEIGAE